MKRFAKLLALTLMLAISFSRTVLRNAMLLMQRAGCMLEKQHRMVIR